MKKFMYCLLIFTSVLFACSSDDSTNDQMMDGDPQIFHYSLRVNGDGFNDELFSFYRDSIESSNIGLKFTSRDNPNNSLYFVLPSPIDTFQYGIAPYVNGETSVSSIILQDNGIYLSQDGNVFISEIITDGNCTTIKGSLNINYRRQDNAPGNINVQGSFEVPTSSICDE
ncbi:hypothetical protein [Psychroserpens sp.]|uniref:hypothetical protein n=1 Tax=Psychroserpens sp. TaxID=2020870 RepID=UPI002B26DF03|nr:hypothetical protein [Psychroserpens sp.]